MLRLSGSDMLDEFSTVKLDAKKPADTPATPADVPTTVAAPAASAPETGVTADGAVNPENMTEEDFAKQLQAGMANLLGELESSVRTTPCQSSPWATFSG